MTFIHLCTPSPKTSSFVVSKRYAFQEKIPSSFPINKTLYITFLPFHRLPWHNYFHISLFNFHISIWYYEIKQNTEQVFINLVQHVPGWKTYPTMTFSKRESGRDSFLHGDNIQYYIISPKDFSQLNKLTASNTICEIWREHHFSRYLRTYIQCILLCLKKMQTQRFGTKEHVCYGEMCLLWCNRTWKNILVFNWQGNSRKPRRTMHFLAIKTSENDHP